MIRVICLASSFESGCNLAIVVAYQAERDCLAVVWISQWRSPDKLTFVKKTSTTVSNALLAAISCNESAEEGKCKRRDDRNASWMKGFSVKEVVN
jgi:hypothetical protein